MINKKSKTLREFSLRITDKKGDKYILRYGYDMSNKESGHYLNATVNDKPSGMGKIKALKIPAITQLIDSIGRDVTGMPEKCEEKATKLLEKFELQRKATAIASKWKVLKNFFQVTTSREESNLSSFAQKYFEASPRARKGLLRRYINSRRVTFITNQKALIKALRVLHMKGTDVGIRHTAPKIVGYLDKNPYNHYYKRDIDYIRKARVNLFTKVLNRSYVPA